MAALAVTLLCVLTLGLAVVVAGSPAAIGERGPATPPGADSPSHRAVAEPTFSVFDARLRLPHRFRFELQAINGRRDKDRVIATFSRRLSTVSYDFANRPRVSGSRIRANLGRYGRIHLRFRRPNLDTCRQGTLPGIFRGQVRFTPEQGIPRASARRLEGDRIVTGCGGSHAERTHGSHQAASSANSGFSTLTACRDGVVYAADRSQSGVEHGAEETESPTENLVITRNTGIGGSEASYVTSSDLTEATVSPGLPFSGQGTYEGGVLSGDLSVSLLGLREPVPLTPSAAQLGPLGVHRCP